MSGLPSSPWTGRARLSVAVALAVGLALVVIGYAGANGEQRLDDEIGWLNLAVVGVLIASAAEISFLIIGRRQVSLLRRQALSGPDGGLRPTPTPTPVPARPTLVAGGIVTVPGSTWYHRPDCLLVAGKAAVPARPAGELAPCAVCSPEPV